MSSKEKENVLLGLLPTGLTTSSYLKTPWLPCIPGLPAPKDLDRMIDSHHPYALDVNWKDLSKELIEKAHAKGVKIFSDRFGENQRIESYVQAIRAGIDVISTNKVSVICEAAKVK